MMIDDCWRKNIECKVIRGFVCKRIQDCVLSFSLIVLFLTPLFGAFEFLHLDFNIFKLKHDYLEKIIGLCRS